MQGMQGGYQSKGVYTPLEMQDESSSDRIRRYDRDTGINPDIGVFDMEREDEEFKVPLALRIWSCVASALTFPLNIPCMITQVKPDEDKVVTRCGYVTSVLRRPGPHLVDPFTSIIPVDMKLDILEITKTSVNDSRGNPLIVSAQFSYRVQDALSSIYAATNLKKYLIEQGASTLKAVLSNYPFDKGEDQKGPCLRMHSAEIENHLKNFLQEIVKRVGIKIEKFSLLSVTYDPLVEKLLLAKQEAEAEVIATQAIATGTVGIIQKIFQDLKGIGHELDEADRSQLAKNLTLMLVNRGGSTNLTLIQGSTPPSRKGKEKGN